MNKNQTRYYIIFGLAFAFYSVNGILALTQQNATTLQKVEGYGAPIFLIALVVQFFLSRKKA